MTHDFDYNDNIVTSSSTTTTSTSSSTSSSSSSTSTTTTGRSTLIGVLNNDQWDELARYFEACIGTALTPPVVAMIKEANSVYSISYDVIRACITETGFARRPTPNYFRAILDRCECDQIETLADWKAAKAEFTARKAKYKPW